MTDCDEDGRVSTASKVDPSAARQRAREVLTELSEDVPMREVGHPFQSASGPNDGPCISCGCRADHPVHWEHAVDLKTWREEVRVLEKRTQGGLPDSELVWIERCVRLLVLWNREKERLRTLAADVEEWVTRATSAQALVKQLEQDLRLNASMLAKQTDLAREAELVALSGGNKRAKARA